MATPGALTAMKFGAQGSGFGVSGLGEGAGFLFISSTASDSSESLSGERGAKF